MERLAEATVAIFGIGGVGSYAAEALARSGVGSFVLVDDDRVCTSNINRQIIALRSTLGKPKVMAMRERILDINPAARVEALQEFYGADSAERLLRPGLSYVVDAIDTVSSKIDLIVRALGRGIPVISSMGAGNKLDPTRLEIADIYETSVCPLARVMRRELKSRGVKALTVVYSREPPIPANAAASLGRAGPEGGRNEPGQPGRAAGRRSIPGSVAFVPPAAGLIIASKVVRDLISGS